MTRRKHGEGNIRQRENGRWECSIVDGFHSDGRRRRKSFYGDTEEEVAALRDAYIRAQETGVLMDTDWETSRRLDYPCNPSTFREKYKEALASIPSVRYLSPHSCRHTYVSQMQALGVDLATIQSLVGHADVDMTKHYLHVQDPIRIAAITKFDRAFAEESETHSNIIDFMKSS